MTRKSTPTKAHRGRTHDSQLSAKSTPTTASRGRTHDSQLSAGSTTARRGRTRDSQLSATSVPASLDAPRDRLRAQRLVGAPLAGPADVVGHLLAVQSQDFGGACWAVGQRMTGTLADVERAFDAGEIVRTHVLRPTWHFVAPADLRWLLALSAPRLQAGAARAYKEFDLTAQKLARSDTAIADALRGGQHLTRDELANRLPFAATGTALANVMFHAELGGIIVSGPRRGKQHTYALLDERVAATPPRTRDDTLAELARRYVASHGPARVADLAWWAGLTTTDARRAVELAALATTGDYYTAALPELALADPTVHLLPNYDELLVGFADRAVAIDPRVTQLAREAIFDHTIVANGRVIGTYKLERTARAVTIACTLHAKPTRAELAALRAAAVRYGAFLGRTVVLDV